MTRTAAPARGDSSASAASSVSLMHIKMRSRLFLRRFAKTHLSGEAQATFEDYKILAEREGRSDGLR